ncbi:hypothetical protein CBER1_10971 [Cercospora berteroae]|uniref:NmrA-like domain-containing protein n=1 Tax=Cercospora berteroae TaxID=357750 RepID=A0A2S6CME6_9PEZI|nr:hypothetical protein CBER1_10971 [Cercospora berteroae]
MSKLLAIFGATGNQGSSIINFVLNDPELSTQYRIRAITRDVSFPKAKALPSTIEVVAADTSDPATITSALKDVHTVFLMSTPAFGPNALSSEFQTIKTTVDIAISQNVQYIIFSTLPPVSQISSGKYTLVTPFDAKAKAEEYIRSLSLPKSPAHSTVPVHSWRISCNPPPPRSAKSQSKEKEKNTGKFVGAILADLEKFKGKTLRAMEKWYSLEEIVEKLSEVTGKRVEYRQVESKQKVEEMGFWEGMFVEYFGYLEEFGYFGPGQEEELEWSRGVVRGELVEFEKWLERQEIVLT